MAVFCNAYHLSSSLALVTTKLFSTVTFLMKDGPIFLALLIKPKE